MKRSRFDFVCLESEAGRDSMVTNHGEYGMVDHCAGDHLLVKTPAGEPRCWDYRECEESFRSGGEFPWR